LARAMTGVRPAGQGTSTSRVWGTAEEVAVAMPQVVATLGALAATR